MAQSVPYLSSPGSIRTALDKIAEAATPDRVTGDFVQTVLGLKGGTGSAIIPFLKRIGLVATDGSPTELYKRFRNKSAGKSSIAAAIKMGYAKLAEANEYFYKLNDTDLKALLVQVTGAQKDSSVVASAFGTLKILKSFADFEGTAEEQQSIVVPHAPQAQEMPRNSAPGEAIGGLGLNLSYTINLNLPATSDQAVFNAIFRSLKEFLITDAKG